jgi:hypothetical protein
MVWWPRVKNVSKIRLSKLQRLACLAITGAMKTTPTAATEVLLGLPPLHVMIAAQALAGIYRLMRNKQWRPKSTNFSHTIKISGHGAHPYRWKPICQYQDMPITSHSSQLP